MLKTQNTKSLLLLLPSRLRSDRQLPLGRGDGGCPPAGGRESPEPGAEERERLPVHHPPDRQAQS